MFVVAGVSGNTGSVVANVLLSQGKQVRVLVRDAAKGAAWKSKGAEVAVADVHGDEAALTRALSGAEGAYLLLPPLMREDFLEVNARATKTVAKAAKAAGVPHVVLLSSIGAQHTTGTGPIVALHWAESELKAAGVDTTFVRAAYFMENLANGLHPAAHDGVLPTFGDPAYPIPMVATEDIGRTAARALLSPRKGHHVIHLTGPKAYSFDDAAAAFGGALGRPVKTVRVPDERIADTLVGYGMPRANAASMQEMTLAGAKGLLTFETTGEPAEGTVSLEAYVSRLVATSSK
jgi:uncharacterized protein YbjT (DUF2867 family)